MLGDLQKLCALGTDKPLADRMRTVRAETYGLAGRIQISQQAACCLANTTKRWDGPLWEVMSSHGRRVYHAWQWL